MPTPFAAVLSFCSPIRVTCVFGPHLGKRSDVRISRSIGMLYCRPFGEHRAGAGEVRLGLVAAPYVGAATLRRAAGDTLSAP
jgi:hypothetical protein